MKVLIIDNYDSFVYILAQMIGDLGAEPCVHRNDEVTLEQAMAMEPDSVVISPGPGHPADRRYFGVCTEIIRVMGQKTPTLGVCLGHQGIVHSFGGRIVKAERVMHGKTSRIEHDGLGVFEGVKSPLTATRYHSLVADISSIPKQLVVSALSLDDRQMMGVRHDKYPIEGIQFHPESVLTKEGRKILRNFLRMSRR